MPCWFRISVQPMPADPRSGRKGALTVWQVDEITQDRAREEASFAKVQAAIAYLDSAPAGFFTADADGNIAYLNATLPSGSASISPRSPVARSSSRRSCRANSAALIARVGRGRRKGTRRFDIDLVKSDGTSLPVRSSSSAAGGLAGRPCAGAQPRAGRGRGGRRRRLASRGCSTRHRSPSPRSMRRA